MIIANYFGKQSWIITLSVALLLVASGSSVLGDFEALAAGGQPNRAPAAPVGSVAAATAEGIDLDWADNQERDLEGYTVYRSMISGGPYSALNGILLEISQYNDIDNLNGTYYYVVTASDFRGNESDFGEEVSATYYEQLQYEWPEGPVYGMNSIEGSGVKSVYPGGENQMWRDLATYDLVITQPWQYLDPTTTGWGYGFTDSIRTYNSNTVVLSYYNVMAVRWDSEGSTYVPTLAGVYASLEAGDLFAKDTSGDIIQNGSFNAWIIRKVPAAADTLAVWLYRALKDSPTNMPWTGLMLDFTDYPVGPNWQCNDGDCNNVIDFDEDGIAFNDDPDDQALYIAYFERLYERLNHYYKLLRPAGDYILMSNGYGSIHPDMAPNLDAAYYEGVEKFVGWGGIPRWEYLLDGAFTNELGTVRTDRPLTVYETQFYKYYFTQEDNYWLEALSLAGKGMVLSWNPPVEGYAGASDYGRNIGPCIRYLDYDTGAPVGNAVVTAVDDNWAICSREYENITAYAQVCISSGSFNLPQPYMIVTNGTSPDTLSRGGGWPRQEEAVKSENKIHPLLATCLLPCTPNPFNPKTTLNFSLKENSRVELAVFNIKGQLVKRLLAENMTAGEHTVVWHGRDSNGASVASGVYFARFVARDVKMSQRLLLLK